MMFQITKYVKTRTDDELLADLKKVAEANGGKITQCLYRSYRRTIDSSIADESTICKQIGWNKALILIGVKLSKSQNNKKISEEDLLEEILRLWIHFGRQPTSTDIKNGASRFPRIRFRSRFGSWGNALVRFVEWVNNENHIECRPIETNNTTRKTTTRIANLRLRFKVMQRDNFRCCICGVSPATDLTSNLHIDHILPWSKGGETVLENLQTLCQKRNYGKGDLFKHNNDVQQ